MATLPSLATGATTFLPIPPPRTEEAAVRKLLDARGLAYEEVTTQVEMDRSQPGKLTFRNHTEIRGEIPEEVKEEILREARECPVYRLLQAEKEFLY